MFSPLGLLRRTCKHKLQQAGSSKCLGRVGDPLSEETLGTRVSLVLANTQMHPPAFHGHGGVQSASVSPASFLLPGFPSLGRRDQGAQIQNRSKFCALSKKNLCSSNRVLSPFPFLLQCLHLPRPFSAVWCEDPSRALSQWFFPFSSLSAKETNVFFSPWCRAGELLKACFLP